MVILCATGLTFLLKISCFCDEAVCDAHDLSFHDELTCRSFLVDAIVEPRIETIERLFGVEKFPHISVVLRKIHVQDPCVLAIYMA